MHKYILENIVEPIEQALSGEIPTHDLFPQIDKSHIDWLMIKGRMEDAQKAYDLNSQSVMFLVDEMRAKGHERELCKCLLPLYDEWIFSEGNRMVTPRELREENVPAYRKNNLRATKCVSRILEKEQCFSLFIKEDGLLGMTERYLELEKRVEYPPISYSNMLIGAIADGYTEDWKNLYSNVYPELTKGPKDYNKHRVEYFCQLMAVIMIQNNQELIPEKKIALCKQLRYNWSLFAHLYSIMTGLIIGSDLSNPIQIVNLFHDNRKEHAHLLIACLKFRPGCLKARNAYKQVDYNAHYKKLIEAGESKEQDCSCDELFSVIFPKAALDSFSQITPRISAAETQRKLKEQQELIESQSQTIKIWMKKTEQLESRVKELEPFQDLAISMRNSYLENAIPIETLANSIKAIRDSNVQFQVFAMLNQLLRKDTAWRNHRDELEEEIGKRFFGDENAATHEQTEMLRANLEQQTNILQEVANKKTIGTLVMEQHNHGGGLSLPNTQEQGLLE